MTFEQWWEKHGANYISGDHPRKGYVADAARDAWNAAMICAEATQIPKALADDPFGVVLDSNRYRWLRHDSKDLKLERSKVDIVELYHGAGMDERIDKAMAACSTSAREGK